MRIIFITLCLLSLSFATEVVVPSSLKLPQGLKERFVSYWEKRGEKKFSKTYSYEIPYLQYLHSRDWYQNFFIDAPQFKVIAIHKLYECGTKSCILGIKLYRKKSSDPIYLHDKWIKIDGVWYHKYRDSYLPHF